MSDDNNPIRAHLSRILQRHLEAVHRHEAAEERRAAFRVIPVAPVERSAGDMALHLAEMVRCCLPEERAELLCELIDKAERRGRISAATAADLHARAADICATLQA